MSISKICLLFSGFVTFASFILGIRYYFRKPEGGTPGLMKYLELAGFFCLCLISYGMITSDPECHLLHFIASGLFCLSLFTFVMSIRANQKIKLNIAFTQDSPQWLNQEGPYSRVRHPIYSAYFIAWTAGWIGSGRWLYGIGLGVMGFFYIKASQFEEDQFLNSTFASDYRSYQSRTGRFFPRLFLKK